MNNYKLKELKIEVSYNCPLACVHCSSDANPENQESMSLEKCIEIIGDAVSIGVNKVSFTGGEPLTWYGITEVIAFSNKMGLTTTVYTSGNCNNFSALLDELSAVGLNKLIFSVFSDSEEEHNRITRRANSFNNTIQSMSLTRMHNIHSEIHFVALASNYMKLPQIAEMAQEYGVERVSVLRFVPQGRGRLISAYDTLSKAQNLELKRIITDLREDGYDIRTGSPLNVLLLNDNPKCMAAQNRLTVTPDLCIYPCDAFKKISSDSIAEGDVFSKLDKYGIVECWEKSEYLRLVRNAVFAQPSEPCKSCKSHNKCLSGCLAQKYLHHSSLDKNPDPACLLTC